MTNDGQVANPPEEGPRRAFIVVVNDKEIATREYVTMARSEKEAAENISNGFYITESEAVVIEHLSTEVTRVECLDDNFMYNENFLSIDEETERSESL